MSKAGNILLAAAVVALVGVPLALHRPAAGEPDFVGTDDRAEQAIKDANPDYVRWARPVWEPPGCEVESMLFAVQAAAGTLVLGYVLGYYRGRAARPERPHDRP